VHGMQAIQAWLEVDPKTSDCDGIRGRNGPTYGKTHEPRTSCFLSSTTASAVWIIIGSVLLASGWLCYDSATRSLNRTRMLSKTISPCQELNST
jgi:hypothetical protein